MPAIPTVRTLGGLAELVRHERGLYVRYSHGPDADADRASVDYESGLELPGLSVNPLDPEAWWTRPLAEWLARQLCNYVHLRDETGGQRRAWVLRGRVVARGPDNEPLIDDVEPVAWIDASVLEEAKSCYESRFARGRDSTTAARPA